MKKIIIVLMLVVMLTLTACTADKGGDAVTTEAKSPSVQQWTYVLISEVCSFDSGTNEVVCKDPATGDETMLSNIIGSQASKGYELDEVVLSPKGKSFAQTFIFRKAYVEEAAAVPAE